MLISNILFPHRALYHLWFQNTYELYCFQLYILLSLISRLAYQELVGGVLNMRTEHFQRLNGYSNLYWGWGAEDDDMAYRYTILKNINIIFLHDFLSLFVIHMTAQFCNSF